MVLVADGLGCQLSDLFQPEHALDWFKRLLRMRSIDIELLTKWS
jgi:hypothetical protein